MTLPKLSARRSTLFSALCCLVYFSSYIARLNYGAAMAEIVQSLNITKTLASMAITGSFITYGIGQITSGIIGDYIPPRLMIFVGLVVTSICNILVPLISSIHIIMVIWCLNGFAQSMIWPSLVRTMSMNLSPQAYQKTCVAVSISSSAATIAIYFIVPLCITLSGWRTVFGVAAVLVLLTAFLWLGAMGKLALPAPEQKPEEASLSDPPMQVKDLLFHSGLLPIMAVILLMGFLRDGITTWMPVYIHDTFQLGTSLSILSTAILPIISIISLLIAPRIYKLRKNEIQASALIWGMALICSVLLLFTYGSQMILSVLLMAVLTGCMHGVNLMLIGLLPARYSGLGRISMVSGILNAFTYAGSALSAYGMAALSEQFGWHPTIMVWCAAALLGTLLNAYCTKKQPFL